MLRYETSHYGDEVANAVLPGKASKLQVIGDRTAKPTQVGEVEYSKALERTREKELGKLVP